MPPPVAAPPDRPPADRPMPMPRGRDLAALAVVIAVVSAAFYAVLWPGRIMFSDGQYAAFFAPVEQWSDAWIGGWPAAADPAAYAFHPVRLLLRPLGSFNLFVLSAYLVAAAGVFGYLRALDVGLPASALAAIAFPFSGFMVGHAMHTSMLQATAWSVLALAGVETCLASNGTRGSVVVALAVATACLAGHNQLAIYGLLVLATYLAWRLPWALRERRRRAWLAAGLGVATGVALAMPAMLLTLAYLPETPRSAVTYATFVSRAIPPRELVGLFFPFLFGGGASPYPSTFLGHGAFAATCTYVPFVVVVLAAMGAGAKTRGSVGVYWALVVVVATLLALGDAVPVLAQSAFTVPILAKFRAPSRHAMEMDLGLTILAALGFDWWRRVPRRRSWAPLMVAVSAWLIAGWWVVDHQADLASRAQLLSAELPPWSRNPALLIPAALDVVTIPTMLVARRISGVFVLVALQLATFIGFAPWRSGSVAETVLAPLPVERLVADRIRADGGRVLNVRGNLGTILAPERSRLFGVPSANWYGPLAPQRALQTLTMTNGGNIEDFGAHPPNAAFDMYGVRYVVVDGAPTPDNWHALEDDSRWRFVDREGDAGVYENRRALPPAWLVGDWTQTRDVDAVGRITGKPGAPPFDPAVQALVADVPTGRVDGFDGGRIRTRREGGAVTVDVSSASGGLLVCSINAVRGWTVTVDGTPRAVVRTDHSLLGVLVPPGDHVVALRFAIPGAGWRWGALLSGALGLGLLTALRGRAS